MARRDVSGNRRQCVHIEFKSKAVVHFDQHKAPLGSASLADNSAIHTVAIYALTVIDVVYTHLFFRSNLDTGGFLRVTPSAKWGEVLHLLENWRGASFAEVIHQTGFGEPGKGAPHGDETTRFGPHA
jgi:hypothetical protein